MRACSPFDGSNWIGIVLSAALVGLAAVGCGRGAVAEQTADTLEMLDGTTVPVAEVEAAIVDVMERGAVPGLSCAILNDGKIVYQNGFGYRDRDAETENDAETVFAAASFSKTVFAYLVVLLAQEGVIDLDRPLHEYLPQSLPDYPAYADLAGDERWKDLTARIVLSHSTGFPNWRFLTPDGKLKFLFTPGTRHSYSGEGIALLQMVVQEITGENLESLAQERVFEPLEMDRTSYVWQEAFEGNHARPHDAFRRPKALQRRYEADAAGSMMTTAGDYAKLLSAMLNASAKGAGGKRKASVDQMLETQIEIDTPGMFAPLEAGRTDRYQEMRLGWGLGWGRFDTEHGRAFFHTGHDMGWQNYTVTYADAGIGVVLLSNSDNFEAVAPQLVEAAIGDTHSPFAWLGYPPFDPSVADKTPPPEPVAVEVDPAILARYVGAYQIQQDQALRVKLEGNGLQVQTPDGQWAPLLAESETRFYVPESDYRFVFELEQGAVTGVTIRVQELALPIARKLD